MARTDRAPVHKRAPDAAGELPPRTEGYDPRDVAEGRVLGTYLLGRPCPEDAAERYAEALATLRRPPKGRDAVTRAGVKNPWLLPWLDGGAAIVDPTSPLRQRLIVMLAILECRPDPEGRFEPSGGSSERRARNLAFGAVRAGVYALGGLPLLALLRRF